MTEALSTSTFKELGDLLEKARKGRGWNQEEAAAASGISARRYGDIERGVAKNPTMETLRSVIAAVVPETMRNKLPEPFGAMPDRPRSVEPAYDDSDLHVVDRRVNYQLVDTVVRKVTLRVTTVIEVAEGRTQEISAGGLG